MKLSVAFFLATRQIRRTNAWTSSLIILVMTLTFLNLVVVSGILVGLIEGSTNAYRHHFSGDVIVSSLPQKSYIERTSYVRQAINQSDLVVGYSSRYITSATLEANYKTRTRASDAPDLVRVSLTGIDPIQEDAITDISQFIIEGEFLDFRDDDQIVIAADLLDQYAIGTPIEEGTLANVQVGTKLRISVEGEFEKEFTVKGIMQSKVGELRDRAFVLDTELKKLLGRLDNNVDEIIIQVPEKASPEALVTELKQKEVDLYAQVETWEQSLGEFFRDILSTFAALGNLIGGIALLVASITIFIVIFINAITRKKYIGILKGIGVDSGAIVYSYVMQAIFYALVGGLIGIIVLYGLIKPYIDANPIDFPFSDGILSVTPEGVGVRILVLVIATIIAGYVPAKIVIKKNTLDAILGR